MIIKNKNKKIVLNQIIPEIYLLKYNILTNDSPNFRDYVQYIHKIRHSMCILTCECDYSVVCYLVIIITK